MTYQVPQDISKDKIFIVKKSEIKGRLDPHYNQPLYIELWNKLLSIPYKITTIKESSISVFSGITPKSEGDAYVDNQGIPFIRSGDFSETNEIDFSGLLQIKENIHNTLMAKSKLQNGDLLIAIVGATIGKVGVYQYNDEANINQAICAVRLKKALNPYYVQAFLQTNIGQNIIARTKRPVARANINLEEVGNFPIPLLDSQKQQEIVDYINEAYTQKRAKETEAQQLLDSIDGYLLKELGITIPEIKTELIDRVFYVNYSELSNRLDPYYSLKYFKESFEVIYSGKYPVVQLKSLATLITSGITPKSGEDAYVDDQLNGIPFIRSGNININGELNFEDLLYIKADIHNTIMRSSQVKKNDLMIAIVGATIGQVGIYLNKNEANINQAIALVRLKDGICVQYIKELIKSRIGQLSLNRLKRPVARANINLEEIATIQIVLPPYEMQCKIAGEIQNIRQKVKILQAEGKAILEDAKRKVEQMIIGE